MKPQKNDKTYQKMTREASILSARAVPTDQDLSPLKYSKNSSSELYIYRFY